MTVTQYVCEIGNKTRREIAREILLPALSLIFDVSLIKLSKLKYVIRYTLHKRDIRINIIGVLRECYIRTPRISCDRSRRENGITYAESSGLVDKLRLRLIPRIRVISDAM